MGVIRKKTVTRGGEGGVKYVCDVCSSDITSTVSGLLLASGPSSDVSRQPGKTPAIISNIK